jgi:hypothetical protein
VPTLLGKPHQRNRGIHPTRSQHRDSHCYRIPIQ